MNTISNSDDLRSELDRRKGKLQLLKEQLKDTSKKRKVLKRSVRLNEKAQVVVNEVIKLTQEKIQHHLSDINSLAMASIFPEDPYTIQIDFIPKRGKIEMDIHFERNGKLIHPLDASGGGAVDLSALSFRFSFWTIQTPRSRPIIIFDEPLKFLSKEYIKKIPEFIQTVAKKLDLQIIMASHIPELIACADKVIEIENINGVSNVV